MSWHNSIVEWGFSTHIFVMTIYERLIDMLFKFYLSGSEKRLRSTEDGVTVNIYRIQNKEGRVITRIDIFEK